jgi:hypothetical protein
MAIIAMNGLDGKCSRLAGDAGCSESLAPLPVAALSAGEWSSGTTSVFLRTPPLEKTRILSSGVDFTNPGPAEDSGSP